jgi:serine/threonine protein kinase
MQTLGKYQLIAEIARGGMGIVYLAVASGPAGFSKLFVIKELKPELVDDTGFFDMFLEEARLAARLSHPNIVTTYEVGADGKRPFIVMDYLDGESLGRIIRKKSPKFTTAMHLRILCQTLDGLDYAHHLKNFDDTTASVVHRDMSPQNVFVTFDGQVKIVDFGIAKASDTSIETQAGIFKGKPGYMAPEQLTGDVDTRADLFSVGVMIWEAIAGRRMWPQKGQIEILTALIKSEIPKLGDVKPDAPEELKRICDRATAKQPEDRYETAREMRSEIEAYLESQNERMTVREISLVISSMFEEQRKKMRAVMEKCIAEAKTGAPPSKLPSLAPPPLETTTPRPIEHTMQILTRPSGVMPSPDSGRSISIVSTVSGTPVSQATPDGSAFSVAQGAEQAKNEKRRNAMLLMIALLLVSLSAVATAFVIGTRNDASKPVAGMTAPTATAAATAAAATTVAAGGAAAAPAVDSAAAAESARAMASAQAAAAQAASAQAASAQAAAQPRTRIVYVPVPAPAPKPAAAPAAPAPTPPPPEKAAPTSKTDCNPPFFFEGSKKVFKPGCL